jgi:hypothetical protein
MFHRPFLLAVSLFVVLGSANVVAGSCGGAGEGETRADLVRRAFDRSAAVFSGRVLSVRRRKGFLFDRVIVFRVSRNWKGAANPTITLVTADDLSPFDFRPGAEYLVYAYANFFKDGRGRTLEEGLSADQCSRTGELGKMAADLPVLRQLSNAMTIAR